MGKGNYENLYKVFPRAIIKISEKGKEDIKECVKEANERDKEISKTLSAKCYKKSFKPQKWQIYLSPYERKEKI